MYLILENYFLSEIVKLILLLEIVIKHFFSIINSLLFGIAHFCKSTELCIIFKNQKNQI